MGTMKAEVKGVLSTTERVDDEGRMGQESIVSDPSSLPGDKIERTEGRDEQEEASSAVVNESSALKKVGQEASPAAAAQKPPTSAQHNGRARGQRVPPIPPHNPHMSPAGHYGSHRRPHFMWMPPMPQFGPHSPPMPNRRFLPHPRLSHMGGAHFHPYGGVALHGHLPGYVSPPPPFRPHYHFISPGGTKSSGGQNHGKDASVSVSKNVPDQILVRQKVDNKNVITQGSIKESLLSKADSSALKKKKPETSIAPLLPSLSEPGPNEGSKKRLPHHRPSLSSDMILSPEFNIVELHGSNLSKEEMKDVVTLQPRTPKRKKIVDCAYQLEKTSTGGKTPSTAKSSQEAETGDYDQHSMGSSTGSTQTPVTAESQGRRLVLTVSASPTRAECSSSQGYGARAATSCDLLPTDSNAMEESFDHELMFGGHHKKDDSFALFSCVDNSETLGQANSLNIPCSIGARQLSWELEGEFLSENEDTLPSNDGEGGQQKNCQAKDDSKQDPFVSTGRLDANSPEEFLEFPESPLFLSDQCNGSSDEVRHCNMTPHSEMKLLNEPLNGNTTPLFFSQSTGQSNGGSPSSYPDAMKSATPEHVKQVLIAHGGGEAKEAQPYWMSFQGDPQQADMSPGIHFVNCEIGHAHDDKLIRCPSPDEEVGAQATKVRIMWQQSIQATRNPPPRTNLLSPVSPSPLRTPLMSPVSTTSAQSPVTSASKANSKIPTNWRAGPLPLAFQNNSAWGPASRNRCVVVPQPHSSKFQGDPETAKESDLPEFTALVNFPAIPAQKHHKKMLSSGMKYCVMCGKPRSVCSRTKTQLKGGDQVASPGGQHSLLGGYLDPITIPIQNKGLCTICDVNVWVVRANGMQIKWCKGCKNFRPWAAFGDKGMATKCVRCRDRQRVKYALRKGERQGKRPAGGSVVQKGGTFK